MPDVKVGVWVHHIYSCSLSFLFSFRPVPVPATSLNLTSLILMHKKCWLICVVKFRPKKPQKLLGLVQEDTSDALFQKSFQLSVKDVITGLITVVTAGTLIPSAWCL